MDRLEENRSYYELCIPLLKKLYKQGLYEDALQYAKKLAGHCWLNFSGIYYSFEIENILRKVGEQILPSDKNQEITVKKYSDHRILHICTELYELGGHTKLLFNWVTNDSEHQHSILSTRMTQQSLETLAATYTTADVSCLHTMRSGKLTDQAKDLYQQITSGYSYIVLHTHPDEILTTVVLSRPEIQTPVLLVNHAEHTFWLGASIADVTLQIRETNIPLDKLHRQITNSYFLPIPIEFPQKTTTANDDSKKIVKLLSIGSESKYKPDEKYNFYKEMHSIVDIFPNVVIDIIGVDRDSIHAKSHQHPRIHYHGRLPHTQLKKFREECSLYVEGFPIPSFTAMLETAMFKKPFILYYDPIPVLQLFPFNTSPSILYPAGRENWRKLIKELISNEEYRNDMAEKQYKFILNEYSMDRWVVRLKGLYATVFKKGDHNGVRDVFFNSENEKSVVEFIQGEIAHLSFLENLGLFTKINIFLKRPNSFIFLKHIGVKELFKFFLPSIFYFIKKNFDSNDSSQ